LARAGLDPEVTVLPMDTPEFERRIGELSPTRRVPVLWLGELCVWDSLAIAETVNDLYCSGRLWPADPLLRALGRSMAAEMHSSFFALREALPMNCRATGRRLEVTEAVQGDIRRVCELWSSTLERSGGDGWLLGEWSIADAMYAPVALRFRGYAVDLPEAASAYVARWLDDPDLQAWIAQAEAEPWVIEHEEVGLP
jgi:glutathione S-transferase